MINHDFVFKATTKRYVIRKSIKHWKRMIKWVETQVIIKFTNPHTMKAAIGEDWFVNSCSLCKNIYNNKNNLCINCPLSKLGYRCKSFARNNYSPWGIVNSSVNWEEWLYAAKKEMLPALYSCFELCF